MANEENWDAPLYLNASVSVAECILLIMAFALSAKLSQQSIQQLLDLLAMILPSTKLLLPKSKYLFNQFFDNREMEIHLYCRKCTSLLGSNDVQCTVCDQTINRADLLNKGSYFIHLPIENQLRVVLEKVTVECELSNAMPVTEQNVIKDITDGLLYRRLVSKPTTADNTITLTLNTDGVPIFKSSSFSIWPLLCTVNEINPVERKQNALLLGLWFGKCKPSFFSFMKPFIDDIARLELSGLVWTKQGKQITSLVKVAICTCDSVARAAIQNVKQFNSEYGCSWCYQQSVRVRKGLGFVQAYPYNCSIKTRNNHTARNEALQAHTEQIEMYGVKGPSPLMCFHDFDIIDGFVVDAMHCIDLGVTKTLVLMWFTSANHNEVWYIGRYINEIDKRLLAFRPPSYITRLPRSMSERKYWKASEWRNFLLLYSLIVLKGILPHNYLQHLMLLVDSVYLLTKDSISQMEICTAELLLHKFVQDYELLYGVKYMSYNLNLLLHLPNTVRYWGPLWCYSNYTFENVNGLLGNMYHGTQAVPKQICNTFSLFMNMRSVATKHSNQLAAGVTSYLSKCVLGYSDVKKCSKLENLCMLGKPCIRSLTLHEMVAARELLDFDILASGSFYSKATANGVMFQSTLNRQARKQRRNNFTVSLKNGMFCEIVSFCVVKKADGTNVPYVVVYVKFIHIDYDALVIGSHPIYNQASAKHMCTVNNVEHVNDALHAVCFDDLDLKCTTYSYQGIIHLCTIPGRNLMCSD